MTSDASPEQAAGAPGTGSNVKTVPAPVASDKAPAPNPIPTGFPDPPEPVPDQPVRPGTPGMVTLYAVPPMGTMTVPPLEGDDGEPVVITRYGTEVDTATATRAHEAAALAGFAIREE